MNRHLRQNPANLRVHSRRQELLQILSATQADEDFERDSLASQSSRTTARIQLQEKYVKVATLYKDELTPDDISKSIRDIAFTVMAKSVIYEDIDPADRAFGAESVG